MGKFARAGLPLVAVMAFASHSRAAVANAKPEPLDATATVEFQVFLPLRDKPALAALLRAQQTPGSAMYHQWLTPTEFASRFGPTPASMAAVRASLEAAGLRVTETHTRSLRVAGPASAAAAVFQTRLMTAPRAAGGRRVVAISTLRLPDVLAREGVVVPAFNSLPEHRTHVRSLGPVTVDNRNGPAGAYNYNDLKQAYDYPSFAARLPGGRRLDGAGATVAILIESQPLKSDVTAMFDHETYAATTGVQPPGFRVVDVDGGAPFDAASGGAFEASLDVQQVLGGAPGADVTIVSLPDLSDQSILDGFTYIVEANRWAIVSDSFGSCELLYTAAYNNGVDYTSILTTFDEEFRQGAAQGITFISSSGDSGGLGCPDVSYLSGGVHAKFIPAVESPADDPYVTAVGGGNLLTTAPNLPALTSKYVHENAEGDREITYDPYGVGNTVAGGYFGAGGGVSVVFAQPTYQTPVMAAPGRLLPDVGMLVGGCPSGLAIAPCGPDRSAAIVTFNGVRQGVVGTSVAAPEFASAVALYVEASGQRVGTLNPYLWRMGGVQNALGGVKAAAAAQFFHKNIEGYDGYYRQTTATPIGLMDGNGTPNVRTLFGLTAYPAAGAPRSASNP